MPHAVVLELIGEKLPLCPAKDAHGLFFALLKEVDPELAGKVHAAPRKPFTLSLLVGAKDVLLLRFTTLEDQLFTPFLRALLHAAPAGLSLGKARFQLARVLATPQGHPWAGKQSWEELAASPPRREATFVFKSPTFFATSKPQNRIRYTPLPEPRLILQSLLDKWQEASPSPFPDPEAQILRELFAWEAELAGFRHLRFQRFQAGKASFPGFVGEVRLKLWGGNENLEQALGRLHALAFFSGVGAKTPYGAGFTLPQ